MVNTSDESIFVRSVGYGSLVTRYVGIKRDERITSAKHVRIKHCVQMACIKHALTICLKFIRGENT